jgi:putative transferase (TIGR04331 family)
MLTTKRYLITTADERTWKFERPVIFLGRWCLRHDRRHIWSKMDAVVAEPYGLTSARKDSDDKIARKLEEQLLVVLTAELNRLHGAEHGSRFWRILLGHWLWRHCDVIFNRFHTLQQCIEHYPITGTTVFASDGYPLAQGDSRAAEWACNDDVWNNVLYGTIFPYLLGPNVPIEHLPLPLAEPPQSQAPTLPLGIRIRLWVQGAVGWLTDGLVRDTDAFLIKTYLTPSVQVKLQLKLRQVPKIWKSPRLTMTEPINHQLRQEISQRIGKGESGFARCARELLFELIPRCAIEGFAELKQQVQRLKWPRTPKFIFTSNSFFADEVFQFWVAEKTQQGVPYYVGAHGNYGVFRCDINPSVEEITSDRFLTWGWTDGLPQHTPAFLFKTAGRRPKRFDPAGGLILIELRLPHRTTIWDNHAEFEAYQLDQERFIGFLKPIVRSRLTIRLHQEFRRHEWNDLARWREFDPCLRIDTGEIAIRKIISSQRLVVHSYDSTGILETLSQDIPTLAFWQNGFDHLRESAKPYYQILVDAGIVHLSADSAARKVNEVWDDIVGWWNSANIQVARRGFCERYARVSQRPAAELAVLLVSASEIDRSSVRCAS